MKIRPYEVTDYDAVMALNKQCHALPSPDHILLDKIREGKTWVAEAGLLSPGGPCIKRVVGFLVSIIKLDRPYIYNVAVEPTMQGMGIGTSLIKALETEYSGKITWLQVDASNPAQTLYVKLGYRVTFIGRDYYGTGKDALSMYRFPPKG
jgi:ribosomal protein S18 acetylase RimI-like enzyme